MVTLLCKPDKGEGGGTWVISVGRGGDMNEVREDPPRGRTGTCVSTRPCRVVTTVPSGVPRGVSKGYSTSV